MFSTTFFFRKLEQLPENLLHHITSAPNSGFTMLYGCVAATKGFESTPIIPIIIGVEMPRNISFIQYISLFHYIYNISFISLFPCTAHIPHPHFLSQVGLNEAGRRGDGWKDSAMTCDEIFETSRLSFFGE